MIEIMIRKLGNGYQYEYLQDNGTSVATGEKTAFEAIKSVIGQIGDWEEEKRSKTKDKIEQEHQIAHRITQTLETLVEGEYATKEDIRKIIQEEIARTG